MGLLWSYVKRVLVALQYEYVWTTARVKGCELAVVSSDKQTGAQILVECNAYRDGAVYLATQRLVEVVTGGSRE